MADNFLEYMFSAKLKKGYMCIWCATELDI